MKKTEIILGLLILAGLIMKFNLVTGGSFIFVFSSLLLATFYYLFGFAFLNEIKFRGIFKKESYKGLTAIRIIGAICSGMSLSAIIVGVFFKVQHYPGADTYLISGLVLLFIIFVIALIRFIKNRNKYYVRIFKRIAIIGSVGLLFVFLSELTLVKFQFRNHPEYIKAYEEYSMNPQNEDVKKKEEIEYRRATMDKEAFKFYMEQQNKKTDK